MSMPSPQEVTRLLLDWRAGDGLSIEETAEALGISSATVKREWNSAKVWLHHEIKKS